MALDLFANFERSSNSSLFYRLTSASLYTVSIKLSDLSLLNEELGTRYYATSSINNGTPEQFIPNNVNYTFQTLQDFDCTTPCVCSITVSVSTASPDFEPVTELHLSAVFVETIPTADFIVYPSSVIKNVSGVIQKINLNSSNYTQSEGAFFYGEGHTEVINLSSSTSNGLTANWYIGNDISDVLEVANDPDIVSQLNVASINTATATTTITSKANFEQTYPISLIVTTNAIPSTAPLLTYNDATGNLEFYPYFTSTQDIAGGTNSSNTYLKENIQIKPYQNYTPLNFISPFSQPSFSLPFDYSSQQFLSILTVPPASGIFVETYNGSKWGVAAASETGEWGGEYDSFSGTNFLPNIYAYQFELNYDKDLQLDYFKCSSAYNSTVSVYCSGTKTIVISAAPYDWLPKQVTQTFNVSATVFPIVFAKLFIKNYFNIKNKPVEIFSVQTYNAPYRVENIVLQSNLSPTALTLTGSVLSGTMVFDQIGVADLSATALLTNTNTNTSQFATVVYPGMIEIVQQYDEVNEEYFQTEFTPVVLPYDNVPRMTPNEWAVADNVNSVLKKIHSSLDHLNKYTKLYKSKNKFYGWLGPKRPDVVASLPIYVWQDLECPTNTEAEATWSVFECGSTNLPLTWEYHECEESQTDPTCLGKYCIEWKWKSRRCNSSEFNVKWKDTKCSAEFAKRWRFEKCDGDAESLNCDKGDWKISTIDPLYFPIPSCSSKQRCKLIDVEHIGLLDRLVIAYATEIQLVDTNYNATYLARRGIADELFSFQNIVGVASDENKVFVLDSVLSKVSVFSIKQNSFNLLTTWGTFGLASTPQGLNNPTDIHVDQHRHVWIADAGNECVKKFTFNGKSQMTLLSDRFLNNAPISVCVDSQNNVHCLTSKAVYVFDSEGTYMFEYVWSNAALNPKKINTSYNREVIYLTHDSGIIKFFRTGNLFENLLNGYKCGSGAILQGYGSITQDKFRNVYVTNEDKILKIQDLMKIADAKAIISEDLYWNLNEILVHKEEYIQPWVYLKSFHRLWDNIELFRTSLFYSETGCKSHKAPVYSKEDLVIGQNEIVTNAVINRLSNQLWTNLELLFDYFDPTCSENR